MNTSFFFIGGCSGTGTPPAIRIQEPASVIEAPQAEHSFRTRFGTLTTAFGVVLPGGTGIFIDNGGGVTRVAEYFKLRKVDRVVGLQTHFHADHRLGIQNNPLLFKKGFVQALYAPDLPGKSFAEILSNDFSPETWPISPATLGIVHSITEFKPGDRIGVLDGVETLLLNHPGQAAAFRINLPHGDVVIATDDELSDPEHRAHYARFVSDAAVLYVDMQYRDTEYEGAVGIGGGPAMSRKGWGHSTPDMLEKALLLCKDNGGSVPKMLLIGHHDPNRSDDDLSRFEVEVKERFGKSLPSCEVRFAQEADVVMV